MGVSALGNVTYINQNAPLNSAIQQGARSDMLDLAQSFQNKLELAQETRALKTCKLLAIKILKKALKTAIKTAKGLRRLAWKKKKLNCGMKSICWILWGRVSQITPYSFMSFYYKKTIKTKRLKPYLFKTLKF